MTRFKVYILSLLLCCGLCSCHERTNAPEPQGDTVAFSHAQLLHVIRTDSFAIATIRDAWNPGQHLHQYLLLPHGAPVPAIAPQATVVRIPIRRAVAFSSVHAALFATLRKSESLCGVCDTEYIYHEGLRGALAAGRLSDMGSSMSPDIERLVSEGADALFVSPFENAGHGAILQTGIPIIECADYMESSPLGRAEWMRFYGLLLGCEAQADSLFAEVEKAYTTLREMALKQKAKPTVLCDTKSGSAWYVPGGRSTMGQIFADAGAHYLFADRKQSGSVCLSFEAVYQQAAKADFWLIKYGSTAHLTYESLSHEYKPYEAFSAWQDQNIYGCNTFCSPFYEETPFHPERLLSDLVKIFHPQLLPHYTPQYYHPLH